MDGPLKDKAVEEKGVVLRGLELGKVGPVARREYRPREVVVALRFGKVDEELEAPHHLVPQELPFRRQPAFLEKHQAPRHERAYPLRGQEVPPRPE